MRAPWPESAPALGSTATASRFPACWASSGQALVESSLVLADETLRVERGEIAWPGLAGEVSGRVGLDGPLALEARVTVHADRLGPALGGLDAGGTLTATATLGGRTNQLDGRVRMTSERLAVSGIPIERLEGSGRLQGDTVRLDRLTARVLGAPLRAQGEWTLGGDGRADLDAGPLVLAQLTNVPPQLALDGSLTLHVEASTVRGRFKAFAQTRVRQARALGLVLGEGHLTARVEDRRLVADLSLAEGRITGAASGALAPGGLIDTKLELATLQLSPVLRHLVGDKAKESRST